MYGRDIGEVSQDEEGMRTMVNLAKNMAWLLKCIELGKQNGINVPINSEKRTNSFVRNIN
ncbi:MAG: hypothetical protein KHY88_05415 [Erysipelotrichaceae bacterium]|nr:hypothetical protein [Erysipelotrichaceae bacterium]